MTGDAHAAPCSCAIAVMAKASIPGRAKTRLVPPLDAGRGGRPQHHLPARCRRQPDRARRRSPTSRPSWRSRRPAAPASSASILPERIGLLETVAPTFGECLFHAASSLLEAGHDAVCLLNSDSPTLPTAYLVAAATALAAPGDRIVLGPSTDGGYYLIGLKRPHRRLFEDIDWSTERVVAQTLARARELDLPVHHLPSWYDVDDARRAARAGRRARSRTAASASGAAGRRRPRGRGASLAGCSPSTDLAARLAAFACQSSLVA